MCHQAGPVPFAQQASHQPSRFLEDGMGPTCKQVSCALWFQASLSQERCHWETSVFLLSAQPGIAMEWPLHAVPHLQACIDKQAAVCPAWCQGLRRETAGDMKHPGLASLGELRKDSILLTPWRLWEAKAGTGRLAGDSVSPCPGCRHQMSQSDHHGKLPTWAFQLRAHYPLNNCIDPIDTIC